MKEPKKVRRILYLLIFTVIISLIMFISRGPYISNGLKRIILPELEDAFGHKVVVQNIYINLFPLFIEAKDMQVVDDNGSKIVFAKRVKGYIDLSGFLRRNISIQRLVIKEPDISTNGEQLNKMINSFKTYLEKERRTVFKVKVKVIEVVHGIVSLRENDLKNAVDVNGLSGEIVLKKDPRLKMSIKKFGIRKEGMPELKGNIDALFVFKKDAVEIKSLEVGVRDPGFEGKRFYPGGKGTLKTKIEPAVDSLKRIFNLGQKGEGNISAKGEIRLGGIQHSAFSAQQLKDVFVDLKLNGDFYIQTLMKILEVKEKIEGLVDFQGKIKGPVSNITGEAKARLRNGNLFDVAVNSLSCKVLYSNGVMKFENGDALLYNGKAQAYASLNLPHAEFFTLNVKFNSVDSGAALKLIGWEPKIPAGKVDGDLATSGSTFNPDGRFIYTAPEKDQGIKTGKYQETDNFLSRIKDIKGTYSLRGDILSLSDIKISTSLSNLNANGTVDIAHKSLNLKTGLHTDDISDFTLPYYKGVKGHGDFSGGITGSFDNPRISGQANISKLSVEGYTVEDVTSSFSYEKNLLDVHESVFRSPGEEHIIKGKISFPEAKELFDLSIPVYSLRASLKNADFGPALKIFYKDIPAKGRLDADVKIGGKDKYIDISGNASIEKASLYNIPFDSVSTAFSYTNNELLLKKTTIMKGKSVLTAEGTISRDKRFSYRASSKRILIKDLGLDRMPDDAALSVRSEGHGTFENPSVTLNVTASGGTFKGRTIGSGTMDITIKNRDISLNAALFNEKMILKGNGHLDDKLPWSAELNILPGRYDSIAGSVLKEVPEDLQLNLEGRVKMKGDRKNIAASADISHLTLSLFGQTFSNASPINFSVNNRKLSLTTFTIKSGAASFRLQGGLEFGKEYDISFDGSSSLSPLEALSKRIGYLSGDADFVFSVKGNWEKPEINGRMNVSNASFGFKDYPTYISSIKGSLYTDGDKIVVQKLSGKIGGGNVNISGIVYLKAFLVERFYLEANLENITTTVSKDFSVDFGGNLLYRGTPEAQNITGDIKINRAIYRQMVEWRSWLLAAKAIEKPRAELSVFERTDLNIRISGSENISIDNNVARAPVRISGDMILKGTIANPILFGRLESTEGYAYFRNNEFTIKYASVDFTDPNRIKPIISLTAETTVQNYTIRINLEGEMDHFTLSLSSDPHLEEADILSLLTAGQLGKQTKGLEAGIGAGAATSFLTGKVQDVLEERLRSITGLERFQVEPYVSSTTGTVGTRVAVSKRLIGDKLFVTYANPIGSTEAQVIKIEYLVGKNISLIGNRDERGSLGGDVRFRFEFK
jgi:autotransporter translocation and assembly factor TamB